MKKFNSLLLAIVLCFCAIASSAVAVNAESVDTAPVSYSVYDGYTYAVNQDNQSVTIMGYTGRSSTLTIPSVISNRSVNTQKQ